MRTKNLLHGLVKYFDRKTGTNEVTEEVTGDLTEFERQLLLEQDVMEVRGKVQYKTFFTYLYYCEVGPFLSYHSDMFSKLKQDISQRGK